MKKQEFDPKEVRKLNDQDRMWFVDYWAEYVRTHPDKDWSAQQNILINSMFENAKNSKLTKEEYLKIKGELLKPQKAGNQKKIIKPKTKN